MPQFPIDDLRAFGFSERLIDRWRDTGVDYLLPLQVRAIRNYGFLRGASPENLLVLAPTSSGKTFVAELAAMRHLEAGRRVIYLVPTKALAEEKGRLFRTRYAPLGYRVAIATRERPETDRLVAEGKFDLLVAVYEKMKAFLVNRPELLNQLGLVVVDEIQTLGDRGRGESLDLLLGKIVCSPFKPQFIGISAVLAEGNRLADWLRCELLLFKNRPVELREGVLDLSTGDFRYRCLNSGEEATERLLPAPIPSDPEEDAADSPLLATALFMAEALGEQVIVFVPMRHQSRMIACKLARQASLPPAEHAVEELKPYEETASRDLLLECLRAGTAFHNADLPADLRAHVEAHYASGAIRILVSTSTLGQGVNLTGRNVIQVPSMAAQDPWTGETTFVPLSISRYRNHGGRAARYQLEQDFGRSILLASGPDEAERLYQRYVSAELEPLEAPLRGQSLEPPVMDFIASGVGRNRSAIRAALDSTYTGFSEWRADGDSSNALIGQALDNLASRHLIRETSGGFEATGLGMLMARQGLSVSSVCRIAQWLESLQKRIPSAFESLLILCSTADGTAFPCYLTFHERREADYLTLARECLVDEAAHCPILNDILWPQGGLTDSQMAVLKMAFVLESWIGSRETCEIEQAFSILAGSIANLAAHIHWLACAAMEAAEALGCPIPLREELRHLAARLPLGLTQEGCALAGLHVEGLSRGCIQSLLREGFDSREALAAADFGVLQRLVPQRVALAILEEFERHLPVPRSRKKLTPPLPQPVLEPNLPPRLLIDAHDPGRVWFNDTEIRLTPLPYKLLLALARNPERVLTRQAIAGQVWPDSAVEDQQIFAHARSVSRAFAAVMGEKAACDLIEKRRGIGLRLTLPPEAVEIRNLARQ